MMRKISVILCFLIVCVYWLSAQQWTEIMRIEMVDSTIILPVANIQRFAFDYVNEDEKDTTEYISLDDVVAQKQCVLLDLTPVITLHP